MVQAPAPHASSGGRGEGLPRDGGAAPPFTLLDASGRKRTPLTEFRGRPVALFFFCGCSWCADVAREWAALQRGGALLPSEPPSVPPARKATGKPAKKAARPAASPIAPAAPITVLVYQGTAQEGEALALQAGLDPAQTVLLPDPDLRITGVYQADPCPRVLVIDTRGIVRYVNRGPDDKPREAPAALIAARSLGALRLIATGAAGTAKRAPAPRPPTTSKTRRP